MESDRRDRIALTLLHHMSCDSLFFIYILWRVHVGSVVGPSCGILNDTLHSIWNCGGWDPYSISFIYFWDGFDAKDQRSKGLCTSSKKKGTCSGVQLKIIKDHVLKNQNENITCFTQLHLSLVSQSGCGGLHCAFVTPLIPLSPFWSCKAQV